MKFKIENINNLSDSRQVMESKPNKFITIFIYILLLLLLIFFTWTWFSEKEIVVKAQGTVRPTDGIQTISNIVQGEIKSVEIKTGDSISKGDTLFEIDSTDLEKEKTQIDDQIEKINNDNINLNKLSKFISDNKYYKDELEKLKNEKFSQISSSINKANQTLSDLDINLKNLDESSHTIREQNKINILAQIEERINLNTQNKLGLEVNKKQIEKNIEKCIVKSNSDGKINIIINLQQGLFLQTGAIVANIIPNSDSYKVDFIISPKDIANISVHKDIKYSFEALPYVEYGFLKGKIKSISPDSNIDNETGKSFFTGEGSLNSNVLYSNKGEKSSIKPGMLCEAKIIIRNERMLYYLLEKIGLKHK